LATQSRAQRIEYVRPSPIVVSTSASGDESESDDEHDRGEALEHEVEEHDD
jgi:hypothetical protein